MKANRGAAGVDGQSIAAFEEDLTNNLYKLWNRLSSGSYFPPPVKRVEIKKRGGGTRPLGVPTVTDRIAQAVVKASLEPELEQHFHPDSSGYRPGKSALDAVGVARQRCWRHNWVLHLDLQAFFDTMPHDLLLRAVRQHTDCRWVLLYIERWLKAPVQLRRRHPGTSGAGITAGVGHFALAVQSLLALCVRSVDGSAPSRLYRSSVSPMISSATAAARPKRVGCGRCWSSALRRAGCGSIRRRRPSSTARMMTDGGSIPPSNSTSWAIPFAQGGRRTRRGKYFVNFSPGISNSAAKAIRQAIRSWRLDCRIDKTVDDLARMFNPDHSGLDHLLWSVLQVGAVPDATLPGSAAGALGHGESTNA